MDDNRLTYKIEEVCYDELMKFFAISFEDTIVTVKKAFETLGEFVNESLSVILDHLRCYFADNEERFEIELRKRQLRPIKCIKSTHSAPVYKIVPRVRNRLG